MSTYYKENCFRLVAVSEFWRGHSFQRAIHSKGRRNSSTRLKELVPPGAREQNSPRNSRQDG